MTRAPYCRTLHLAVALALAPASANAQESFALRDIHEVTLDIDKDGRQDRVALVRDRTGGGIDLYIYLAHADEKLDLSRKPALLKKNLATNLVLALEGRGNGSLIVRYGCGGCSNDWTATLTIVHRGGDFLVAGYTLDWETRNGVGRCDVNFLTGKGTLQRDLARVRPIKGKFAPVRLSDWSDAKRPQACL